MYIPKGSKLIEEKNIFALDRDKKWEYTPSETIQVGDYVEAG